MNDDLVKRLRAKCKLLHQCVEMRREAADEIERLELRLELALGASRNPEDIAEIERLIAERDIARKAAHDTKSRDMEIERLRALHDDILMRAEKLSAENERLRDQLSFMTKECKRFEAVVDVAKRSREVDEYGLLSIKKGWDLDKALAALEDDDE